MKQSVQQVKRRQTPAVNKKRHNVTHLRPPVVSQSNHTRLANDKWERQADEAASRILRGEEGVARILRPAPAASQRVPASRGEPLARDLSEELEAGFGADLSRLRIHRDTPAGAAAVRVGARAFASGAHIYFAPGAYDPDSSAGKSLLAHETAHTLQQTGRTGADGRLRVTDAIGAGAIQLEDPLPGLGAPLEADLLDHLERLHLSDAGSTARRTEAFISRIRVRLRNHIEWGRPTPEANALAGAIDSFRGEPQAARGFLFDCFKVVGLYEAAAELLDQDPRLRTAWQHVDMTELLAGDRYGRAWLSRLLPMHPRLEPLWNRQLLQVTWLYLVDLHRPPFPLSRLDELRSEIRAGSDDWQVLGENEAVELALVYLDAFDRERVASLTEIASRVGQDLRPGDRARKRAIAVRVEAWGRALSEDPEQFPTVQAIGRELEGVGARAVDFWDRALSAIDESMALLRRLSGSIDLGEAARTRLRRELPDNDALESLHALLVRHSAMVFEPGAGGGPLPYVLYSPRIGMFRQAVQDRLSRSEDHQSLLQEFVRISRGEYQSGGSELAETLVWVLLFLETIASGLSDYRPALDSVRRDSDYRVGHRIALARRLLRFALLTGWRDLEHIAVRVLSAVAEGHSVLALISDWRLSEQDEGDWLQLENLRGTALGSDDLPLAPVDIALYFQIVFLGRLIERIEVQLAPQEEESPPSIDTLRGQLRAVRREARNFDQPERWEVTDYEVAIHPADDDSFGDLIKAHPKTQAEFGPFVRDRLVITPIDPFGGVWLWTLPALDDLFDRLVRIPALLQIAAEHEEVPGPPDPADRTRMQAWFGALAAAAGSSRAVRRAIHAHLRDESDQLNRRVTSLMRLRWLPVLAAQLNAFGDSPHDDPGRPADVLSRIRAFARSVYPRREEQLQVDALVLGLAPSLERAFIRAGFFGTTVESRYDVITGYLGLLENALLQLENAQQPSEDGNSLEQILEQSRESLQQLAANRESILRIIRAWRQARLDIQTRSGFTAEYADGVWQLRSLIHPHPLPVGGEPFEVGNRRYQITAIHEAFTFHPAYGTGTGAELEPLLIREGARGRPLVTLRVDDIEQPPITDRDRDRLAELARIVDIRAHIAGLEASGEVIEGAVDLMLAGIELVPGGQALTFARIGTALGVFIAVDLPQIREELLDDPEEMLERLIEELEAALTAERLWDFLLTPGMSNPLERSRRGEGRRPVRRRRGRLGRLIAALSGIGGRVSTAYGQLQERMIGPLYGARARIATRPRLAHALYRLADVLPGLSGLAQERPEELFADLLDAEGRDDLAAALIGLVQGLREMELPREVVPMDLATETVLVFFLDRFGGRGRMIRFALERTGALDAISDPLSEALRGTAADPNGLWQREVLPLIRGRLEGARDELVDGIYDHIGRVLRTFGASISHPGPGHFGSLEIATRDWPETELFVDSGRLSQARLMPWFSLGYGRPLPPDLLTEAQFGFGHDLSHVRLHDDARAALAVRALGAQALATGSHVLLDPALGLHSGKGSKVLRHELAHVLQQTGPRPLGTRADRRPRPGRPGVGVRFDRSREVAADRMAKLAAAPRSRPVSIQGTGGEGLYPDAASRVLRLLGDPGFGPAMRRLVERAGPTGQATELQRAQRIFDRTMDAVGSARERQFATFLKNVYQDVRTQVTDAREPIRGRVPALANLARRRGSMSQSGQPPVWELDRGRYLALLEGYVFAVTGVSIHVNLAEGSDRVEGLRIDDLHLGVVDRGSPLWDGLGSGMPSPFTNAEKEALRVRLRILGPQRDIWSKRRRPFRVRRAFAERFRSRHRAALDVAGGLPDWETYTDWDASGGFGLRIGLHGNLQGLHEGRESHHTTQYLLVQYFCNDSRPKVFPPGRRLPGFEPGDSEHPDRLRSTEGSIEFRRLHPNSSGRGDAMPAILIATETHQTETSRLHITSEQNPDGRRTQARAVHNTFQEHLPGALRESADDARFDAYVARSEQRARRAVYSAAQSTYRWMYTQRMRPGLADALRRRETAYYVDSAMRDHATASGRLATAYDPETSQGRGRLERVITAAHRQNNDVMTNAGWRRL